MINLPLAQAATNVSNLLKGDYPVYSVVLESSQKERKGRSAIKKTESKCGGFILTINQKYLILYVRETAVEIALEPTTVGEIKQKASALFFPEGKSAFAGPVDDMLLSGCLRYNPNGHCGIPW